MRIGFSNSSASAFKKLLPKTSALFAGLSLALLVGAPGLAHAGLVIVPTFDASVATNFGANTTAFENAFTYAASQFSQNFDDNIQINLVVKGVAGTSVFGQSNSRLYRYGYSTLYNALVSDAKTPDDFTAIGPHGSVSASNPSPNDIWDVTRAQGKALGLIASDSANDGTVSFGAGFHWNFDTNNRAVPREYDIAGIMMHEISETLGRLGLSGRGLNRSSLVDSFSYTGDGTRGMTNGPDNAFSIDGGQTLLKTFNDAGANNMDTRDWASGSNDAFNQFSYPGVVNNLSDVDVRLLDVIGYDRVNVPEPASPVLVLAGLGLLAFSLRNAKRRLK